MFAWVFVLLLRSTCLCSTLHCERKLRRFYSLAVPRVNSYRTVDVLRVNAQIAEVELCLVYFWSLNNKVSVKKGVWDRTFDQWSRNNLPVRAKGLRAGRLHVPPYSNHVCDRYVPWMPAFKMLWVCRQCPAKHMRVGLGPAFVTRMPGDSEGRFLALGVGQLMQAPASRSSPCGSFLMISSTPRKQFPIRKKKSRSESVRVSIC